MSFLFGFSAPDLGMGKSNPVNLASFLPFTKPGALVLDPFLGGGTTAVAALETARRCVGIELSEEYAAIARKRCEDVAV